MEEQKSIAPKPVGVTDMGDLVTIFRLGYDIGMQTKAMTDKIAGYKDKLEQVTRWNEQLKSELRLYEEQNQEPKGSK